MTKKVVFSAIAAILLVSIMTVSISAVVWSDYGIALNDNSGNTMYYELGVGQDRVRAETGVNTANTYTVYTSLSVDTIETSNIAFSDEDESSTVRYVEIVFDSTDIFDVIYRAISSHIVEKGSTAVGWETLRKEYNASTREWSDYSW